MVFVGAYRRVRETWPYVRTVIGHIGRRDYRGVDCRRLHAAGDAQTPSTRGRTASRSLPDSWGNRRRLPRRKFAECDPNSAAKYQHQNLARISWKNGWMTALPRRSRKIQDSRHFFAFVERGGWYAADRFISWLQTKLDTGPWKNGVRKFSAHDPRSVLRRDAGRLVRGGFRHNRRPVAGPQPSHGARIAPSSGPCACP